MSYKKDEFTQGVIYSVEFWTLDQTFISVLKKTLITVFFYYILVKVKARLNSYLV